MCLELETVLRTVAQGGMPYLVHQQVGIVSRMDDGLVAHQHVTVCHHNYLYIYLYPSFQSTYHYHKAIYRLKSDSDFFGLHHNSLRVECSNEFNWIFNFRTQTPENVIRVWQYPQENHTYNNEPKSLRKTCVLLMCVQYTWTWLVTKSNVFGICGFSVQ